MIAGSLDMLPSASLAKPKGPSCRFGMYEPRGRTAPDIAGKGTANPTPQILSVGMMLRHSLNEIEAADAIDMAVRTVIASGLRTGDIWSEGTTRVGTAEMGNAIANAI
jgi:3-isopropylmalate dehydrogenase